MKLPWNKKYQNILFHVLVGVAGACAIIMVAGFISALFANLPSVWLGVKNVLGKLFSAFSLVFSGFVIAYLLDPLVNYFQMRYERLFRRRRLGKSKRVRLNVKSSHRLRLKVKPRSKRVAGTAITYVVLLGSVVALVVFTAIKMKNTAVNGDFASNVVNKVSSIMYWISEADAALRLQLKNWGITMFSQDFISDMTSKLTTWAGSLMNGLTNSISSVGGVASSILMGFFIAFYFLSDKAKIKAWLMNICELFLSAKTCDGMMNFLRSVNDVFSSYIRGQLTVALIIGVMFSAAFSLIGIDLAVLIGIISGVANIVPYFGPVVAFILAIITALFSGSVRKAVYAAIAIIIIQQIDNMFISPRVVGKSVELSPPEVLIAITAGGSLFGLLGMVLAVPTFALLKILGSQFLAKCHAKKANKACKD